MKTQSKSDYSFGVLIVAIPLLIALILGIYYLLAMLLVWVLAAFDVHINIWVGVGIWVLISAVGSVFRSKS